MLCSQIPRVSKALARVEGLHGETKKASRAYDVHLSRAYGAPVRTHPPTLRRAQNTGHRPLPVPPFGLLRLRFRTFQIYPLTAAYQRFSGWGAGRGGAARLRQMFRMLYCSLHWCLLKVRPGSGFLCRRRLLGEETRSLVLLLWSWGWR